MTGLDYFVLAVIGISVLISVIRGAVRELLSLVSWALAIYLAIHFYPSGATLLPETVSNQTIRVALAFVVILLGSLLVLALVSILLSRLIKHSPLSGIDRVLGALIGLVRAVVILTVLALGAGMTTIPKEAYWREAKSRQPLEALARWARDHLPAAIAFRIHYD